MVTTPLGPFFLHSKFAVYSVFLCVCVHSNINAGCLVDFCCLFSSGLMVYHLSPKHTWVLMGTLSACAQPNTIAFQNIVCLHYSTPEVMANKMSLYSN